MLAIVTDDGTCETAVLSLCEGGRDQQNAGVRPALRFEELGEAHKVANVARNDHPPCSRREGELARIGCLQPVGVSGGQHIEAERP